MTSTHHREVDNSAPPFNRVRSGIGGVDVDVLQLADFVLPLEDAGSGAVTTALGRGTGAATFTRATVAWTKLASGLWASVASGVARSCYIGADTAPGAYGGYFAEPAAIQLVTPDASIRDMTDASWVKGATMTVTKDGIGIDGAANSCSRLTGGAVAATNTAFQTLTAAASSRTYSVWLKRVTGTGTINISQDGGSTYTDVTSQINTSTFTRVSLTASVLNAAMGIQVVTSTDVILADFNQFEALSVATSPMATAGAARNTDTLTYPKAGNYLTSAGTCYAELFHMSTDTALGRFYVCAEDASGRLLYTAIGAADTSISSYDGTTINTKSGIASLATGVRKCASSWGLAGQVITGGGITVTTAAFDGVMGAGGSANIGIGCDPAGGSRAYGTIKNVRIWKTQLPSADLVRITA